MKSKYIKIDKEINLEQVAKAIKEGKLVVFPTETVYGIGADATNEKAVKNIFTAKGRKSDNPLIVHISNINMLKEIVEDVGDIEKKLIKNFWPGPLTIIFKRKKGIISDSVTGGLDTVGVRMPSNKIAKMLIEESKTPIAAPSANISGKPSGTKIEDILEELDGKVEYILDDGASDVGVESTVVRIIEGKVIILRPGKITKEDIERLGIDAEYDKNIFEKIDSTKKVMSPGMKYKHYAPNKKCIMIYSSDNNKMVHKINETCMKYNTPIVICRNRNRAKYNCKTLLMGDILGEIARNIFMLLRKVDKEDCDVVIIEGVEKEGIGVAIYNRLIRACEYNYIEV